MLKLVSGPLGSNPAQISTHDGKPEIKDNALVDVDEIWGLSESICPRCMQVQLT